VRVPGLIDLVLVSDEKQIAWLNEQPALVRQLDGKRSVLHRLLAARVLTDLRFHGMLLPVFQERANHQRAARKAQLEEDLRLAEGRWGQDVAAMAAYLRGQLDDNELGARVQSWCGKLFYAHYQASVHSYDAGRLIAGWASAPPWRSFAARVSGRLQRAKDLLWRAAEGDPHCVHATSIGAENIAKSLHNLRSATHDPKHAALSGSALLRACLVAPPAVLRGCSERLSVPFLSQPLTERSVVVFLVAKAFARTGDLNTAFLADSWSACPARDLVPELLSAALQQAGMAQPVTQAAGTPVNGRGRAGGH
jgi:hypothetical protein